MQHLLAQTTTPVQTDNNYGWVALAVPLSFLVLWIFGHDIAVLRPSFYRSLSARVARMVNLSPRPYRPPPTSSQPDAPYGGEAAQSLHMIPTATLPPIVARVAPVADPAASDTPSPYAWWREVGYGEGATECVLVAGERGTGKTTLLESIAKARILRNACRWVYVISAKYKPGDYLDMDVYEGDITLASVEARFNAVERELDRRRNAVARGAVTVETLQKQQGIVIIVDEDHVLTDSWKVPSAVQVKSRLVGEGREYGMNLIVGTWSATARGMGQQGQVRDFRKQFHFVRLGEHAWEVATKENGITFAANERPAVLETRRGVRKISTAFMPKYKAIRLGEGYRWQPPIAEAKPDTVLADIAADVAVRDAATPPPVGVVAATSSAWTEEHVRVAAWLSRHPRPKLRWMAIQLYGEKAQNGGSYVEKRLKPLIAEVEQLLTRNVDEFTDDEE